MNKLVALLLFASLLIPCFAIGASAQNAASQLDLEEYYESIFCDNVPLTDKDIAQFIAYDEVSYFDDAGNVRYFNNRNAFVFTTYEEGYELYQNDPEAFYNAVGFNFIQADFSSPETSDPYCVYIGEKISYTCGTYKNGEFVVDHIEYVFEVYPSHFVRGLDPIDQLYFEAKFWNQLKCASAKASFVMYPGSSGDRIIPGVCPATRTSVYRKDVNYDGSFDLKDLAYLKKYVAGRGVRVNYVALDYNCDGSVDVKDVRSMKKFMAGNTTAEDDGAAVAAIPQENYTATFIPNAYERVFKSYILSYFDLENGSYFTPVCGLVDNFSDYSVIRAAVNASYFTLPELDETFFDENVLVVGYLFSECCNFYFTVDGVSYGDGTITVDATHHTADCGLDAIEEYAVLVAVDRDFVPGASSATINVTRVDESIDY